jgi:ankyrin repeat protein
MLLFLLPFSIGCTMKKGTRYSPEKYFSQEEMPIAQAIYDENKSELRRLLKLKTIDINKPGKEGYTYLQYAIEQRAYDIVKELLENGADPNVLSPTTYVPGAGKPFENILQIGI